MTVLARARVINVGLFLLSLLSIALVLWTEDAPTTSELAVRQRHLLEVFRREDVRRIEIRQAGGKVAVLRRDEPTQAPWVGALPSGAGGPTLGDEIPSEWSLVEPLETDADSVPIEQLLGSLQYATWEREADPAQPGFASVPLHELSVQVGDRAYRLRLGGDAVSPPGARYVQVSLGQAPPRAFVIKKRLVDELFVEADAFRGRHIVPYRKSSVRELVLSSAAGVRRLERAGGMFRFVGMHDDQRAERGALDRIFMAFARARAEPFLDIQSAQAALTAGTSVRASITPLAPGKPEASLEFGGRCPSDPERVVAIRHLPEPLAGCVDRSVLYALREPASALIDRQLFSFHADEVDTVSIVEGSSVLEFARGGDGFVLRQPRSAPLDGAAAEDRLDRILDIQGDLLSGSSKPRDAESYSDITLTLWSAALPGEERSAEKVRLGPPLADGGRRVYREADGAVLVISAESALSLHADATLLKEHQVFDYASKDVRRVESVSGKVRQILERSPEGGLRLLEPRGFDADGALAVALIDQLRELRALRWVTDREGGGFGLAKPRASVRFGVEVDGKAIERTLHLGARAPGGYYAKVDRDPGVFVAPRALERALGTWLLDRAVFSADRDSIVELALEAEGLGRVELRRVGGELILQKSTSGFDASRITELLDMIESLRTEAAVHLGAAPASEGFRRPVLSAVIRRQSPENVGMPPLRFSVGSRDSFQGASVYYARLANVNATYALPREQVQRLLDLF